MFKSQGWVVVVAYSILVSAQGPLVLGFGAKGLGPGLDNKYKNVGAMQFIQHSVQKQKTMKNTDTKRNHTKIQVLCFLIFFFFHFTHFPKHRGPPLLLHLQPKSEQYHGDQGFLVWMANMHMLLMHHASIWNLVHHQSKCLNKCRKYFCPDQPKHPNLLFSRMLKKLLESL